MKKIQLAALMLAVASGSLSAKTLVTVNGQAIDSSVIDAQVKAVTAQNKQIKASPALRQHLTERQVISTVVGQEAKRLKLDQSPQYRQALAQSRAAAKKSGADKKANFQTEWAAFEGDLLGQAYAAHAASQNPVQEKDIKAAYDEFSKFYKGSEEVQIGEIITRSSADAQKAIADLKAKKSFVSVLNQYTVDEEAKRGGGIHARYVPLKDLQQSAPPLYAAVKDLKKGGFTETPVQSGNFYGVFYVNDRRKVQLPSFEQAKGDIARDLQAERIDRAVQSLLQKADIKPAK